MSIAAFAVTAVLMTLSLALTHTVSTRACNVRAGEFERIVALLNTVDTQSNLEEEKRIAKRALKAIEDLAGVAWRCSCGKSAVRLEAAALRLRQGRETSSYRQLSIHIHGAIEEINAGIVPMEICDAN